MLIQLEIPEDVHKYILKKQGDFKSTKGDGVLSQASTIIMLLKERMEIEHFTPSPSSNPDPHKSP